MQLDYNIQSTKFFLLLTPTHLYKHRGLELLCKKIYERPKGMVYMYRPTTASSSFMSSPPNENKKPLILDRFRSSFDDISFRLHKILGSGWIWKKSFAEQTEFVCEINKTSYFFYNIYSKYYCSHRLIR